MSDFTAWEFNDFNDWPCKFFLHSCWRFYGHSQFKNLLNLSCFNVNNGIKHLANKAQFDFSNQTLNGFEGRIGVGNTEKSNTGKADVSEYFEITGAAYFIKNNEVWANKEDYFRCFLKISFKWRILSDTVGELQITGRFHGFHHSPNIGVEVFCNSLGECCFSRARASTNENTAMVVC